MKKSNFITNDDLLNAGFKFRKDEAKLIGKYQKEEYGIDNYVMYQLWTTDEHPIKLDIDNGWNNRGAKWSLHIDNNLCETIGYADIDTIEQFNKLMEVFDSEFRL